MPVLVITMWEEDILVAEVVDMEVMGEEEGDVVVAMAAVVEEDVDSQVPTDSTSLQGAGPPDWIPEPKTQDSPDTTQIRFDQDESRKRYSGSQVRNRTYTLPYEKADTSVLLDTTASPYVPVSLCTSACFYTSIFNLLESDSHAR
jgi:hypothetical protein